MSEQKPSDHSPSSHTRLLESHYESIRFYVWGNQVRCKVYSALECTVHWSARRRRALGCIGNGVHAEGVHWALECTPKACTGMHWSTGVHAEGVHWLNWSTGVHAEGVHWHALMHWGARRRRALACTGSARQRRALVCRVHWCARLIRRGVRHLKKKNCSYIFLRPRILLQGVGMVHAEYRCLLMRCAYFKKIILDG